MSERVKDLPPSSLNITNWTPQEITSYCSNHLYDLLTISNSDDDMYGMKFLMHVQSIYSDRSTVTAKFVAMCKNKSKIVGANHTEIQMDAGFDTNDDFWI
jgi:hypothetical protein